MIIFLYILIIFKLMIIKIRCMYLQTKYKIYVYSWVKSILKLVLLSIYINSILNAMESNYFAIK